jgi:hypothetical protein
LFFLERRRLGANLLEREMAEVGTLAGVLDGESADPSSASTSSCVFSSRSLVSTMAPDLNSTELFASRPAINKVFRRQKLKRMQDRRRATT